MFFGHFPLGCFRSAFPGLLRILMHFPICLNIYDIRTSQLLTNDLFILHGVVFVLEITEVDGHLTVRQQHRCCERRQWKSDAVNNSCAVSTSHMATRQLGHRMIWPKSSQVRLQSFRGCDDSGLPAPPALPALFGTSSVAFCKFSGYVGAAQESLPRPSELSEKPKRRIAESSL